MLEQALLQRRPVSAFDHAHLRLLFPHALGWAYGRAKILAYQGEGPPAREPSTPTPDAGGGPCSSTRSTTAASIDGTWQTADNYSPHNTGINDLYVAMTTA